MLKTQHTTNAGYDVRHEVPKEVLPVQFEQNTSGLLRRLCIVEQPIVRIAVKPNQKTGSGINN